MLLSGVSVSCGDGVCSGAENQLTCPVDCLINTSNPPSDLKGVGEKCVNDSVCFTDYCLYGVCSLKSTSLECDFDYECLSGVCFNGECTKPSLWERLDASKKESFGDDVNTNNGISILVMIFTGLGFGAGGVLGILLGFILIMVEAFFFAYVGWLSGWIAFVLIVGYIVAGTGMVILSRR